MSLRREMHPFRVNKDLHVLIIDFTLIKTIQITTIDCVYILPNDSGGFAPQRYCFTQAAGL